MYAPTGTPTTNPTPTRTLRHSDRRSTPPSSVSSSWDLGASLPLPPCL